MTKQAKKPKYLHEFPYGDNQIVGVKLNCPKCNSFMKKEVDDPELFMVAGLPSKSSGFRCPKCNHRQPVLEVYDNTKNSVVNPNYTGDDGTSMQTLIDDGDELEEIRRRNEEAGPVVTEAEREAVIAPTFTGSPHVSGEAPIDPAILELQRLEAAAEGQTLDDADPEVIEEMTSDKKKSN